MWGGGGVTSIILLDFVSYQLRRFQLKISLLLNLVFKSYVCKYKAYTILKPTPHPRPNRDIYTRTLIEYKLLNHSVHNSKRTLSSWPDVVHAHW